MEMTRTLYDDIRYLTWDRPLLEACVVNKTLDSSRMSILRQAHLADSMTKDVASSVEILKGVVGARQKIV